jgi:hypothetical protein
MVHRAVTRAAPPVKPSMQAAIGTGVPTMSVRLSVMHVVQQLSTRRATESVSNAAKFRAGLWEQRSASCGDLSYIGM